MRSTFFTLILISAHFSNASRVCVKCAQTQISRVKNSIFHTVTSARFRLRKSASIPSRIHSLTACSTALSREVVSANLRTLATYWAYSLKMPHCCISSVLCPSFTFKTVTTSSSPGSPERFSKASNNRCFVQSGSSLEPL